MADDSFENVFLWIIWDFIYLVYEKIYQGANKKITITVDLYSIFISPLINLL